MEKINDYTMNIVRENLVGKKIRLKGYKTPGPNPLGDIVGRCDSIGYNPHIPEFGLQVIIDRMPCTNINLSQISLEDKI